MRPRLDHPGGRFRPFLFLLGVVALLPFDASAQDEDSVAAGALASGRSHYLANCARCHGVDGAGGEGPPLARPNLPRAPTDSALVRIIATGIEGSAMGPVWWLSRDDRESLAAFVRSLASSGADGAAHLPGDPARGRLVYEEAGCARCHTVRGLGTGRGPDLTAVGARRGPEYLRQAIVDPGAALPRGTTAMPTDFVDYLVVRVEADDGRSRRGMRMNEDTYTLQIKDARGIIRSYYKPDLRALEREFDRSLMQSYADRLSEEELDDLVAYLASLTGRSGGIS